MKPIYPFALLLTLFLALPALVRADAAREARSAIQSQYDAFDRAYMKKDFKTVAGVFAPDCVFTLESEGRRMKVSRVLQGMEALSTSLTISRARTHIGSVKATESGFDVSAVWTGNAAYAPSVRSKDDPARHTRAKQSYQDTWKKTDRGWRIIRRIIEGDDDKQPDKKNKNK